MQCEQCFEPAKFTATYPELGKIALCSIECNRKFYIGCGAAGKPMYLAQVPINALVLDVVDWRTIKVLHIPFGTKPVEYRLADSHKFNKSKLMPSYITDEKQKRFEWLKQLFARVDDEYPVVSVSPVGEDAKGRPLAHVYVPQNCDYCFKSLAASAARPDAVIGDLGTSQTFAMMQLVKPTVDSKWMQNAVHHPGALTKWGVQHHIINKGDRWNRTNLKAAERYAAKTPTKTDDKRVQLAETFAKYRART